MSHGLNFLFLKRFYNLFHVFIPISRLSLKNIDESSSTSCCSCYQHPLLLIFLILANEGLLQYIIYLVGLLPSKFYVQLSASPNNRDLPMFRWLVLQAFIYVCINAFLKSLSQFLASVLYVKWRTNLVCYLQTLYFTKQRYYHLSNTTYEQKTQQKQQQENSRTYKNYTLQTSHDDDDISRSNSSVFVSLNSSLTPSQVSNDSCINIDNPDQRITQDTDQLCKTLAYIIPLLLVSPFTIAYYVYRTWQITGYWGPLTIFLYFILSTIINKYFISCVSRTIYKQNSYEGSYRYLHTQIRTHNESIAFYNGGLFELKRFNLYFISKIRVILYRRTVQEFFLSLTTNLFDYIGSILSYLLISVALFVFHLYDHLPQSDIIKTISQISFITMYLIYRFSMLNDITDKMTIIAANTHRVQTFIEWMKKIDTKWNDSNNRPIITVTGENDSQHVVLQIKDLSYSSPANIQHVLMKNLNLILHDHQRLLITGDSGIGKTSLFRVLHSIWPITINGKFSFDQTQSFLLPQRPYFTNQPLYNELFYPNHSINLPTTEQQSEIEHLLAEWNLSHLLQYVNSNLFLCPKYSWNDLLSPGELQRLSFIRFLLQDKFQINPIKLLFLDEIASSLDLNMEMKIYNYLIEKHLTIISIGHRQTLKQYHHIELKLYANGLHTIENIVHD
ncbi:unnamed protein product [Didymodactylos carnosus]|uniref:ABC transmembrane type-1 domain-containing protein n=1 Tax=Didymodactylos carnosus TaxID=1234261 RepID=A0A814KR07_9BILA|nr:unnamed protein product [Didymodactylos carnosus]CAF1052992.1 unnamed protein product [Didymodactylos carnosus]CAF3549302.1 unnamed protein product [Didymodactylos carnosus]CAF3822350.1 unnamed protein product [Didymodactylos carnosus]